MSNARDVQQPDHKTVKNIIGNYVQNEKALVDQLYFNTRHGTTIGGFREDIWKGMFEQIIPKKFAIEQSVFIIDSSGRVSNEVDLAIFDETYTPYIFRYGSLKFLPIEAVAVVIECKSSSLDKSNLKNWAESIAALKTSTDSYTRTITHVVVGKDHPSCTQTATRPLRILCCLNKDTINEIVDSGEALFDITIRALSKDSSLKIEFAEGKKSLQDWYLSLNHADGANSDSIDIGKDLENKCIDEYTVADNANHQVSLLSFNLQLNQLLMLINNPMLFPHYAYAEMFDNFAKKEGTPSE